MNLSRKWERGSARSSDLACSRVSMSVSLSLDEPAGFIAYIEVILQVSRNCSRVTIPWCGSKTTLVETWFVCVNMSISDESRMNLAMQRQHRQLTNGLGIFLGLGACNDSYSDRTSKAQDY